MARFKLLNIIPIVYFILSCGLSVWIGFELYYTINPGNEIVDVDPDGRGNRKETTPLKPQSSVIPPPEGKLKPVEQHLDPKRMVDDRTDHLKDGILHPPKVVEGDPINRKETDRDRSRDKTLPIKEELDPQHLLKQKHDLTGPKPDGNGDDVFGTLYYGLSNKIPKNKEKVPKSDGGADDVFGTLYYGLSNKVPKTKKKFRKPDGEGDGVFANLYYGLSNKIEKKPAGSAHKEPLTDLHEKRGKNDEEDYKVKVLGDLYYGLSNKIPDSRKKAKPFEKHPKIHDPGPHKKEEAVELYPKKVEPVPKTPQTTVIKSPLGEGKDTPPGKADEDRLKKTIKPGSRRDKAKLHDGDHELKDAEDEFST